MDTLEHEGFPEGLEELAAAVHVSPILRRVHVLRARMARRLGVAEANVTDRIELTKVSDQDDGYISERVVIRVQASLSKVGTFGLLQAAVHLVKEACSYEGYFIDDEQGDVLPALFQSPTAVALEFLFETCFLVYVESRTSGFRTEANVECRDTSVRGQFHFRRHFPTGPQMPLVGNTTDWKQLRH